MRDVAEQDGTPYVELAESLRASPLWSRELTAGDGAHPGSAGYALMADLIMPAWLAWLAPGVPI